MALVSRSEVETEYTVAPLHQEEAVELSVVMPCLNEAETLERCIVKAQLALEKANIAGEVVIADNGSTDGSIEIAERLGARVVNVRAKGYGNALMGVPGSCDRQVRGDGRCGRQLRLGHIPRFVEQLRKRQRW